MARILIVEDEEKIARFVTLELEHEGYQVEHAADGRTAVDLALERDYDLILLDVLLPQLNGMEVLRRVRKHKDVPVIMVTARDAVMDKVAGLDAGADDYLTKPFAIEELFARIRVALKRAEAVRAASGAVGTGAGAGATGAGTAATSPAGDSAKTSASPSPATLAVGSVALDPDRREVTVGGSPIVLTAREFDVLALLMAHAGTVLTRERIAHEALGYDYVGDTNNVDVHIAHLRAKIEDAGGARIIQTVRGVGTGAGAGTAGGAGGNAAATPPASDTAQVPAAPSPAALTVGSVALDPDRREVTVGGSPIVLTAREFDVLALLMAHAGTVLTRERIAHEALGYDYVGDTNNVDVHIAHLRAKIEDAGGARIIQTVRGVGYVCRA